MSGFIARPSVISWVYKPVTKSADNVAVVACVVAVAALVAALLALVAILAAVASICPRFWPLIK